MKERELISSERMFSSVFVKNGFVITNKKIFGRDFFGRYFCFPIDSIRIVGTSFLWGVYFETTFGKLHFKFIKNKDEIPVIVSYFLIHKRNISLHRQTQQFFM